MNVVYNTLPDAAQGAADSKGLRPHAAGPHIECTADSRQQVEGRTVCGLRVDFV